MKKIIALVGLLFTTSAIAADAVSVANLNIVNVNGVPTIQGIATNNTDKTIKAVFVKFKLYEGKVVTGNTVAQGSDIEAGESWKFQAPVVQKFDSYKVSSVDVY